MMGADNTAATEVLDLLNPPWQCRVWVIRAWLTNATTLDFAPSRLLTPSSHQTPSSQANQPQCRLHPSDQLEIAVVV